MRLNPPSGRDGKKQGNKLKGYWQYMTIAQTWNGDVHDCLTNANFYNTSVTNQQVSLLQEEGAKALKQDRKSQEFEKLKDRYKAELLRAKTSIDQTPRNWRDPKSLIGGIEIHEGRFSEALLRRQAKPEISNSQYLAQVGHEIKNPLNSILLLSHMLASDKEKNLTEEQLKYASVIRNAGRDLQRLVDNMLDYRQLESGKMRLDLVDMNLTEFCSKIESIHMPLALQKDLNLSLSFETQLESIKTDDIKLQQVLTNLVTNAIKFTNRGQIKIRVYESKTGKKHSLHLRKGALAFEVTDTGSGISQNDQQHVFDAYSRGSDPSKHAEPGTGLGLAISKEIAESLGGALTVQSVEGMGSIFTLYMPFCSENAVQDYNRKRQ